MNKISGTVTEIEKNVRGLLSEPGKMVTTDISGCKYHHPMSMKKFNPYIQYVGVLSSTFNNILIRQMIREKR